MDARTLFASRGSRRPRYGLPGHGGKRQRADFLDCRLRTGAGEIQSMHLRWREIQMRHVGQGLVALVVAGVLLTACGEAPRPEPGSVEVAGASEDVQPTAREWADAKSASSLVPGFGDEDASRFFTEAFGLHACGDRVFLLDGEGAVAKEVNGADFEIVPASLSTADGLNGISWRGLVKLNVRAEREFRKRYVHDGGGTSAGWDKWLPKEGHASGAGYVIVKDKELMLEEAYFRKPYVALDCSTVPAG
ncbi:hypothetical protein [Stenotrophomonas acidaminiphila]|uniref:hypothetical protein n=1 Tax=Stenotrophomonas acidaminiphila TaxID=128780 RepID=UPI0015FBDCE0|nr:hypothetical protein [Stenotrophomonas acidaminiphila]